MYPVKCIRGKYKYFQNICIRLKIQILAKTRCSAFEHWKLQTSTNYFKTPLTGKIISTNLYFRFLYHCAGPPQLVPNTNSTILFHSLILLFSNMIAHGTRKDTRKMRFWKCTFFHSTRRQQANSSSNHSVPSNSIISLSIFIEQNTKEAR